MYPWSNVDKKDVEGHPLRLRVMSYNVLGAELAYKHQYLYR